MYRVSQSNNVIVSSLNQLCTDTLALADHVHLCILCSSS